jgi:phenylacetate-CoA ligase
MPNLESLYLRLPVGLQNLACSLEGWRLQRSRFDAAYAQFLAEAESRAFLSVDEACAYRDERLHRFVQHAATTVPYYRRWFRQHGVDPQTIRTLDDLARLPILTKAEVQEHYADFVSEAVPEKERIIAHTSGTTGGGLRFATTLKSVQQQLSVWWRYRRWHGLQPDIWCGYFGGRSVVPLAQSQPPFWRYNHPGRQLMFSGYHFTQANLGAYLEELRRSRPPWLHGYPSLLALLAAYVLETNFDLGWQIRWITIGAENLLPQQSELIERAFGVRPLEHYGMAEAVANISECERGALHVDEDFAAVEFIPNPHGEGYQVIGTNFTNPALPLLRYDAQDLVMMDDTTCACGRPGRVVTSIDGRQEDYVILPGGARLGRLDHIFKDLVNIQEAQIVQRQPDAMTIRIARGRHYTEQDESRLLAETRQRVGQEIKISIEYFEQLERSRSGKLRFVISEIPTGQLQSSSRYSTASVSER